MTVATGSAGNRLIHIMLRIKIEDYTHGRILCMVKYTVRNTDVYCQVQPSWFICLFYKISNRPLIQALQIEAK